jgi:hypothetical protein
MHIRISRYQGSSAFMQRGDQNVNILYETGRYTAANQDVTDVRALKQFLLRYIAH